MDYTASQVTVTDTENPTQLAQTNLSPDNENNNKNQPQLNNTDNQIQQIRKQQQTVPSNVRHFQANIGTGYSRFGNAYRKQMEKQNKLFGRNKYISPVIFAGTESDIGKIVKVKIQNFAYKSLVKFCADLHCLTPRVQT